MFSSRDMKIFQIFILQPILASQWSFTLTFLKSWLQLTFPSEEFPLPSLLTWSTLIRFVSQKAFWIFCLLVSNSGMNFSNLVVCWNRSQLVISMIHNCNARFFNSLWMFGGSPISRGRKRSSNQNGVCLRQYTQELLDPIWIWSPRMSYQPQYDHKGHTFEMQSQEYL